MEDEASSRIHAGVAGLSKPVADQLLCCLTIDHPGWLPPCLGSPRRKLVRDAVDVLRTIAQKLVLSCQLERCEDTHDKKRSLSHVLMTWSLGAQPRCAVRTPYSMRPSSLV